MQEPSFPMHASHPLTREVESSQPVGQTLWVQLEKLNPQRLNSLLKVTKGRRGAARIEVKAQFEV